MPVSESFDIFTVTFWIIVGLIVLGFIFVITMIVLNFRRVRKAGHNPLTLQSDIATRLLDSDALGSQGSVEDRLATLEELRATRVIDGREYTATRSRLLAQL